MPVGDDLVSENKHGEHCRQPEQKNPQPRPADHARQLPLLDLLRQLTAVWCVNTIWNGIVGMRLTIEKSVINVPYSDAGIFLDSRCTPHISTPLDIAAIISHPLCRKNAACCEADLAGVDEIFSAAMSAGKYENEPLQGSEFKKRRSRFFPRSNSESEIHSSAVCACATSLGRTRRLEFRLRIKSPHHRKNGRRAVLFGRLF